MTRHIVAWYALDRAFGGPEEGGWWYDTGELARVMRVCLSERDACAYAARANRLMERLQRNLRSLDSVLYDGERYRALTFEYVSPPFFPASQPRYS